MRTILARTTPISLLIISLCYSWANPGAQVRVKPTAEVECATITLGDIANVQAENQELSDQLKAVTVGSSPLPGKNRTITKEQIITALKRSGFYDSVELLCPQTINVFRRSTVLSSEAIFEAVSEYILNSQPWQGKVFVEPARTLTPEIIPTGKLEIRVKSTQRTIKKGKNYIPVDILVDGKTYRSISIPVVVRLIARVPISSKAILRGEVIDTSNIVWEERDVTSLPEDIVIGELQSGCIASAPIPQGAVLRQQWLTQPPVVHAGDDIFVVVTNGAIRITEKGSAVQDGQIGSQIKIRLQGAREVRAKVEGPGIARIHIDGGK
jgi:flagella basal body P-ring formation protein FlgA